MTTASTTNPATMPAAMPSSGAAPGSNVTDAELLAEITKKKRPWGWILFVLVAALGVGAYVYRSKTTQKTGPRYTTSRVSLGEVTETIEATGTVQPVLSVQVGAQVSGRVINVHTDFNRTVREGELLAELDPDPFQTRVNEARASESSSRATLARLRADLAIKERDFARARELRERGLNAQADLDAAQGARDLARAAITVAQADVARTAASLASVRTQLTQARIFSPISGTVISRQVDPGQTVAASLQAPTLFVIAQDLTRMRVIADIDEADVGRLREGMDVEARVEAFQGERFRGTITQLRYGSTTTAGVVTYPAVIDVANPELKLRPGMTATVTVTTARLENVLRVPNAALRYRPAASQNSDATGSRLRRNRDAGVEPAQANANGSGSNGANASDRDNNGPRTGRVFILRDGRPQFVRVRILGTDGSNTAVEAPELRDGVEVITDEVDESAARTAGAAPAGGSGGGGGGRSGGSRGPRMF